MTPQPVHFRLALAHLAFCAATIRALPSALIVRFPVALLLSPPIELAAGLGSPRFKGAAWPVNRDLACCNLRISESIAATMLLMSMTHPTPVSEVDLVPR